MPYLILNFRVLKHLFKRVHLPMTFCCLNTENHLSFCLHVYTTLGSTYTAEWITFLVVVPFAFYSIRLVFVFENVSIDSIFLTKICRVCFCGWIKSKWKLLQIDCHLHYSTQFVAIRSNLTRPTFSLSFCVKFQFKVLLLTKQNQLVY